MVGTTQDKTIRAGYKQTEVGVIPEEWLVEPLVNCCDYVDYRGKTPRKTQSGTLLITARNVRKGFIDYEESKEYVATDRYDLIMRRGKPQIGDVIITTEAPLGNVAQLDREDVALAQRIIKYRPKRTDLCSNYLKHYLLSERFQDILDGHASGSTARGIKGSVLHQLPVVIPRLGEQEAIATALSDADAMIVAQDELIAKKRQVKQGAMQELLAGKKRLPGFSGEWEVRRLGDVVQIVSGGTPKTTVAAFWDGGIKWCTPTDITRTDGKYLFETGRTISAEGLGSCSAQLLPTGALLLCSRATIGEVRIAASEICTNQGFKSLVCGKEVNNEFLYYLLLTMKPQMIEKAIGSTFLEISKKDTASLEVSLPRMDEQIAIAQVLSDMDADIAALEAHRDKTQALKQGMVQQLLTGNIRLI